MHLDLEMFITTNLYAVMEKMDFLPPNVTQIFAPYNENHITESYAWVEQNFKNKLMLLPILKI